MNTDRRPGLSARLKLTLSYAGLVLVSGAVLLAVVWLFLLRYVPDNAQGLLGVSPNRFLLSRIFGRRGRGDGPPAGVRPRRRMGPRRPDARTAHPDQ